MLLIFIERLLANLRPAARGHVQRLAAKPLREHRGPPVVARKGAVVLLVALNLRRDFLQGGEPARFLSVVGKLAFQFRESPAREKGVHVDPDLDLELSVPDRSHIQRILVRLLDLKTDKIERLRRRILMRSLRRRLSGAEQRDQTHASIAEIRRIFEVGALHA